MARPHVVDGGDALQFWRAAANILNKQLRTADRGWSSSLEGSCEHGIEPSGSIKCREVLEGLHNLYMVYMVENTGRKFLYAEDAIA
jgi:hypothetical protein